MKKGYAFLITVIVIGGIMLAFLLSNFIVRMHGDKISLLQQFAIENRVLAESCFESSALQFKRDPSVTSVSLSTADSSCNINFEKTGDNLKMTIQANIKDLYRKTFQATLKIYQIKSAVNLSMTAWKEL